MCLFSTNSLIYHSSVRVPSSIKIWLRAYRADRWSFYLITVIKHSVSWPRSYSLLTGLSRLMNWPGVLGIGNPTRLVSVEIRYTGSPVQFLVTGAKSTENIKGNDPALGTVWRMLPRKNYPPCGGVNIYCRDARERLRQDDARSITVRGSTTVYVSLYFGASSVFGNLFAEICLWKLLESFIWEFGDVKIFLN